MQKSLKSTILVFMLCQLGYSQIYMEMAMDTTMSYEDIVTEGESFFDQHGRGQHTGYKSFQRWQYWMKRCLDKEGHMMSGVKLHDAFHQFQAVHEPKRNSKSLPTWTDLGPYEAGNTNGWSSHLGRITSIAVDDNDLNHILVGSPTGGVWKTTDGGANWEAIYDFETVLDIYSLAISPHNPQHYYIGTWGAGIRRSVDGGQTWIESQGVSSSTRIIDIAISPVDPNICIAINEGGNVFQSSTAGERWDVSLIHSGTLYDVEFKPSDANTVYVSGKGAIFKSTDKGWTFTEMAGPWQSSGFSFNPIMMTVSAEDPNYLYALEADNGGFGALYLSQDGGNSFAIQSSNANEDNNLMGYVKTAKGGQAPRDMDIAVNPQNKNEVHIGGIMTHRSLDGGQTWEQTSHWLRNDPLPFIHADIDIIVYKEGRAFFGTDGGLFTTDDGAVSFTDRSSGLSIRQFYRLAISRDGELLVGGSQDNGAGLLKDSNGWWDFIGADGMEPIIDKDDKDLIYASIQYGNIYKTSNGGVTLDGGVTQTPGFGDWVTPLEQDPVLPNTLYQGKSQLYKTTDGMVSWSTISNFQHTDVTDTLMQEIDIALTDNNYIIAGFEKKVYKTTNGGASWSDISPAFSFSNVNYISIHPTDKNWITMTLSGTDSRVVQTTDGGASWQNIMANLPDVGAECVVYEGGPKNGIYVSMNPGIYYRDGSNPTWELVSINMPNVLVAELEISGCEIYAATYGRGIWSAPLMDDTEYFADIDNDGYGDDNTIYRFCDEFQNISLVGGDCNDKDSNIHPSATEECNGVDDDCNGLVDGSDPNSTGTQMWYRDADGDSFGDSSDAQSSCSALQGYVLNSDDCDDTNPTINPISQEQCNGKDDDCNGLVDDDPFIGNIYWYKDDDGDGYGDAANSVFTCARPDGYVQSSADCDDQNAAIYPGAVDLCNGVDDNCNGAIDDDPSVVTSNWYRDNDGDGYGDAAFSLVACAQPVGYVLSATDCNDHDPNVNPSAIEVCNSIDDDCNGLVDSDDPNNSGQVQSWYLDGDNDGYGDASEEIISCNPVAGYVSNSQDCDDGDDEVYPGSVELCNGKDDDCDGLTDIADSDVVGTRLWFADLDGDGFGYESDFLVACTQPQNFVAQSGDCDDNDSNNFPGNVEVCDGVDNNCDGLIDENCEVVDCDGNYLFIHSSFQEQYHAGVTLYSDAQLTGAAPQLYAAGTSVDLLPGFEVEPGKQFEAIIKPCYNGVSPMSSNLDAELMIITEELTKSIQKKELVMLKVLAESTAKTIHITYSKEHIDIPATLAELPSGQYTLVIEADSFTWNRELEVIGNR